MIILYLEHDDFYVNFENNILYNSVFKQNSNHLKILGIFNVHQVVIVLESHLI